MNRLEKKAWANIGGVILCAIIAGPGIWWMVRNNTKGLVVLIPFLLIGLISGSITYLRNIKSWEQLDEREKLIFQRAYTLSSRLFILFLFCASFGVFLVIGANNPIPAYILPALFLAGLFLMVLAHSAAILIQYGWKSKGE